MNSFAPEVHAAHGELPRRSAVGDLRARLATRHDGHHGCEQIEPHGRSTRGHHHPSIVGDDDRLETCTTNARAERLLQRMGGGVCPIHPPLTRGVVGAGLGSLWMRKPWQSKWFMFWHRRSSFPFAVRTQMSVCESKYLTYQHTKKPTKSRPMGRRDRPKCANSCFFPPISRAVGGANREFSRRSAGEMAQMPRFEAARAMWRRAIP